MSCKHRTQQRPCTMPEPFIRDRRDEGESIRGVPATARPAHAPSSDLGRPTAAPGPAAKGPRMAPRDPGANARLVIPS